MGGGIKQDFLKLRYEFTVRSFFTILFGVIVLAGNAYLFVASAIKLLEAEKGAGGWLHFAGGLLGFLVSCFLIFIMTVHFSVAPQERGEEEPSGILTNASFGGKKGKRIAAVILIVFITLGAGGTALGFYYSKEAKYADYPQIEATVDELIRNGFDKGYTAVYKYTVNDITYKTKGELMSKGEAVPRIGDVVSIKYNPDNPNEIYISTESKFLLGFGCFLIFFGLTVIVCDLYTAKKLKPQFLLAFILLGLTACIFIIYLSSTVFHGLIPFFARNFMLHFVLIFTNVGILELINGIVYIGYKK